MSQDNLIDLKRPELFIDDPITGILRQGAGKLSTHAPEAEDDIFLNNYREQNPCLKAPTRLIPKNCPNKNAYLNTLFS